EGNELDGPQTEVTSSGDADERDTLKAHACHDQPLAAQSVAQRAGPQLAEPPHRGINGDEDSYLAERQTSGEKPERKHAPGESVVEVVHQSRLTDAEHAPIRPQRTAKERQKGWCCCAVG